MCSGGGSGETSGLFYKVHSRAVLSFPLDQVSGGWYCALLIFFEPEAQAHPSTGWGQPAPGTHLQVEHWARSLSITLSLIPQSSEASRSGFESRWQLTLGFLIYEPGRIPNSWGLREVRRTMHDVPHGTSVPSMVVLFIVTISNPGSQLMKTPDRSPTQPTLDGTGAGSESKCAPNLASSHYPRPRTAGPAQRAEAADDRSDLDITKCIFLPSPSSTLQAPSVQPQTFFPIDGNFLWGNCSLCICDPPTPTLQVTLRWSEHVWKVAFPSLAPNASL